MLARVEWHGDRFDKKSMPRMEHGTLLAFVDSHGGTHCMIAWDGYDVHTRGKLLRLSFDRVKVTSWFKWHSEIK